jgi:hypothetical protein
LSSIEFNTTRYYSRQLADGVAGTWATSTWAVGTWAASTYTSPRTSTRAAPARTLHTCTRPYWHTHTQARASTRKHAHSQTHSRRESRARRQRKRDYLRKRLLSLPWHCAAAQSALVERAAQATQATQAEQLSRRERRRQRSRCNSPQRCK